MIIHDPVPIFSNEYNENGSESKSKSIEWSSRIITFIDIRWVNWIFLIFIVKFDSIGKKLHTKKSENEHEKSEETSEELDVFDCNYHFLKKVSEGCPRSSKLEYSKKPNCP